MKLRIHHTATALAAAALCAACSSVGPDYQLPAVAQDAPKRYAERHAGSPLLAAPSSADAAALPADPWGNPYHYANPGPNGGLEILSLGADNAPGGEGENVDVRNKQ